MSTVVTPAQIEKRLYDLSKEIDDVHAYSEKVEKHYFETKAAYEIGLAKSRMKWASVSSPTGKNYTVQEAARANSNRVRTQVDIARSIGTSVRVAMEL